MDSAQELALFETLGGIKAVITEQDKKLSKVLDCMDDQGQRLQAVEHAHTNGGCQASKKLAERIELIEKRGEPTAAAVADKNSSADKGSPTLEDDIKTATWIVRAIKYVVTHWKQLLSAGGAGASIIYVLEEVIKAIK